MPTTIQRPPSNRLRLKPWIGVGRSGQWDDINHALHDSGLDYIVEQTDAWDDKMQRVPNLLVNRRTDTSEIVGVTSDRYGVVQNRDAFTMLDPFLSAGGIITNAGQTEGGMAFMVMVISSYAFGYKGDEFSLYVCCMNSFNGRFPLALFVTPIRVICQNMFRQLMGSSDTVVSIKHGKFAPDRVLSVTRANEFLIDYQGDFLDRLFDYEHERRSQQDVDNFVEAMFPFVPVTPANPRAKQSNERIAAMRKDFVEDYYHAPDNWSYEGTKLGIVNAYYDWITHAQPARMGGNWYDTNLDKLMTGQKVSAKLLASA